MFNSDVLEVGLGLILFFLLASLMATAVRELFEAVFKTRAMDLERGIRELLDDPRGVAMAQSFFDHAHIFSLFRGQYDPSRLKSAGLFRRWLKTDNPLVTDKVGFEMPLGARRALPTYIPAGLFATAMIDLVGRGSASWPYPVSSEPLTLDLLRQRAASLPSPRLQRAVLSAIDNAEGEFSKVKTNLEAWFNGSMDRVSGAYKRRTQAWLLAIGLAIAVLFNLDALTVTQRLIDDPALRKAAAAHAEKLVAEEAARKDADAKKVADEKAAADKAKPEADKTKPAPLPAAPPPAKAAEQPKPAPCQGVCPPASPTAPKGGDAAKDGGTADQPPDRSVVDDFKNSSETVDVLRNDLINIGYPIGWRYVAWERARKPKGQPAGGKKADVEWEQWRQATLGPEAEDKAEDAGRQRKVVAVPAPQSCDALTKAGACNKARWLTCGDWIGILLGWLMTAVAISLGAPFWFDILNKVMVIRSTVKPREKSREEGSEDRAGSAAPPSGDQTTILKLDQAGQPAAASTPAAPPPPLPVVGFEPETWKAGFTNDGELL